MGMGNVTKAITATAGLDYLGIQIIQESTALFGPVRKGMLGAMKSWFQITMRIRGWNVLIGAYAIATQAYVIVMNLSKGTRANVTNAGMTVTGGDFACLNACLLKWQIISTIPPGMP